MAKIKSKSAYEKELKDMIESRTGKKFDPFLLPQVKEIGRASCRERV